MFVDGDYVQGAKKQLTNPSQESIARLAREAEAYEAIPDPHLLGTLDKDIPAK